MLESSVSSTNHSVSVWLTRCCYTTSHLLLDTLGCLQVLEDVRYGMEINRWEHMQSRITTVKFLGELYVMRLVDSQVIVALENPVLCPESWFVDRLYSTLSVCLSLLATQRAVHHSVQHQTRQKTSQGCVWCARCWMLLGLILPKVLVGRNLMFI